MYLFAYFSILNTTFFYFYLSARTTASPNSSLGDDLLSLFLSHLLTVTHMQRERDALWSYICPVNAMNVMRTLLLKAVLLMQLFCTNFVRAPGCCTDVQLRNEQHASSIHGSPPVNRGYEKDKTFLSTSFCICGQCYKKNLKQITQQDNHLSCVFF